MSLCYFSRESRDRFQGLWLLLPASYGLVIANAMFEVQFNSLFFVLDMHKVLDVLQRFYDKKKGLLFF